MRLVVKVIEARNLPAMDLNGYSDPYVKLQLGKHRFRTRVIKKCLNPYWGDEFTFRVDDLSDELVISVLDEDKYFNDDFVGHVKVPISQIFDAEDKSLGSTWYTIQPKSKKSKIKDCGKDGEICLHIFLSQNRSFMDLSTMVKPVDDQEERSLPDSSSCSGQGSRQGSRQGSPLRSDIASKENNKSRLEMMSKESNKFKLPDTITPENGKSNELASSNFDELMKMMESREDENEVPISLSGGVLHDQFYLISPSDLNSLLFSPDSKFLDDLVNLQGKTELNCGSWNFENDGSGLSRVVTYINPASKLVKAVKATEEQAYLKADGKSFTMLSSVSTPDVPYGGTFKLEILHCITSGPDMSSGEQSSHLVITWRINFVQSTMMRGMIENGARQGLKDSFQKFSTCLAEHVKPVDVNEAGSSTKDQVLASLQAVEQSDWKLAVQYFLNFTVISTTLITLYVLLHIWLSPPSAIQGLEFIGLDLPDSIGEVIVCSVLVLQVERVLELLARFMQARAQKGTDHGVKAQGDGWLLTIALIEGSNLAAVDASGFSDPYVVFTCNGRTRTSSIKFQKLDPQWNEIFEFDAMEDPPSTLHVEVFDFDGPFDEATSLGHAEINFLRADIAALGDVWVALQGKLAQAVQSKLHLRIFLDNSRSGNVEKDYLAKMEKEVGKKITQRSPQTNSAFQKLFSLPPEEFLINDFTCHLKRKMPLQGRLFLSPRVIGFHANLFGHRTKFYFLWEDIEDIQVASPNLSSMGSPIIVMTLRKGRGLDARHGAKTQDVDGRLKFHFQSFVSFSVAHRTISALWKARSLSPEQKVKLIEEESEAKTLETEESGAFVGVEDVSMSEVFSSTVPVPIKFVMELFNSGKVEMSVMEKIGCLNYSATPWAVEKGDVTQRQVSYKFDKSISSYSGEVTSSQQKSPLSDRKGWVIEEVMTFHGVPLGEYFNLQLKYQIEDVKSKACRVKAMFGLEWLKSTRHQRRITKNIYINLQDRVKLMFSRMEKDFVDGR